jgi:undecaprenyl-diphosphatase
MRLFSLSLIFFLAFTTAVFFIPSISTADFWIYSHAKDLAGPHWIIFNRHLSNLGNAHFIYPLGFCVLIYLVLKRRFILGIWYYLSFIIGMYLNFGLKNFFERPRPQAFAPGDVLATFSYPSGHAFGTLFFCFFTLWILYEKTHKKPTPAGVTVFFTLLVLLIGFSRVFLGVHWASDVIGGYFFGLVWLLLNIFFIQKYDKKISPHSL